MHQRTRAKKFRIYACVQPIGATGERLDDAAMIAQEAEKEKLKQTFSILTDYSISKDWDEISKIALDSLIPARARLKAVEMTSELTDVEAIEHLINNKCPSPVIQDAVDKTIEQLHERHFTREGHYCTEIIKKRATVCKHCNGKVPRGM